jgi:hypothetical protein
MRSPERRTSSFGGIEYLHNGQVVLSEAKTLARSVFLTIGSLSTFFAWEKLEEMQY